MVIGVPKLQIPESSCPICLVGKQPVEPYVCRLYAFNKDIKLLMMTTIMTTKMTTNDNSSMSD